MAQTYAIWLGPASGMEDNGCRILHRCDNTGSDSGFFPRDEEEGLEIAYAVRTDALSRNYDIYNVRYTAYRLVYRNIKSVHGTIKIPGLKLSSRVFLNYFKNGIDHQIVLLRIHKTEADELVIQTADIIAPADYDSSLVTMFGNKC